MIGSRSATPGTGPPATYPDRMESQQPSPDDVRAVARRYAEGSATAMDLRDAMAGDTTSITGEHGLIGSWVELFFALERWEDTLHVHPTEQTSIEAEMRELCAELTSGGRPDPPTR